MPKSKRTPAKRGDKPALRASRPAPRTRQQVEKHHRAFSRGRPTGGRPPRFPGRTGGR